MIVSPPQAIDLSYPMSYYDAFEVARFAFWAVL